MALTVMAIAGTVAAGTAIYAAASAPGMPAYPNTAKAAWETSNAQAAALPGQRAMQAAAEQGGQQEYFVPAHQEQQQMVWITRAPTDADRAAWMDAHPQGAAVAGGPGGGGRPGETDAAYQARADRAMRVATVRALVPYNAADWQEGGQYASLGKPKIVNKTVKVPAGTQTADFTGYGTADVQGKIARQYAAMEQQLSEKYGPQFAAEAAKEAQEADPEGYAARQEMYQQIQNELNKTPQRPVADLLQQQVAQQVQAGNRLDPMESEVLRGAVADAQFARGQGGSSAQDFATPMETGLPGEQRQQAGISKGMSWLGGGATPEDVAYRRQQQDMANLSAFINGQSPVAEFPQLSSAQQGTTPFVPGQAGAQMPNANLGAASQFALGNWNTQMKQALNTPNSWMTGVSALLKAGGAIAPVVA